MRKILVTGANGQLGSELRDLATQYPQYTFFFTDADDLSIGDQQQVNDFFAANQPDYCINCAAYTAVDKAEDVAELATATLVNAAAVGYLSKACATYHAKLVHISTDYVFDGTATVPYKPEDATNPVSVYGATKLKGEGLAFQHSDAIVIRTAWVYSSYGKNFVKTMIRLMADKPAIGVVADQRGTPTYAADLAACILHIIASEKWVSGIYHYTNEGAISWYDFALAIKTIIHSNCAINPLTTADYPTPARRPAYSVLDKSTLKDTFGIRIPHWEESLAVCIQKLNN